MIIAMFLAHIFGDYILQWDSLALWKSKELKGVLAHSFIVVIVTILFAIPFQPEWLPWALFIGLTHTLIDISLFTMGKLLSWQHNEGIFSLFRFAFDQTLHILTILFALTASGEMVSVASILAEFQQLPVLTYLLGYTFIMMPTWVILKFAVYGLINGSSPNFTEGSNKYLGILERLLITTCVLLGQFILIPVVALPRFIMESQMIKQDGGATLYLTELLASVGFAVLIGLALRMI